MTEIDYATVRRHAQDNGLHLVSTYRAEQLDKWWLASSPTNWVTTEPGKPLAEISAVLDQIDGGEWARREAEREAKAAEHALDLIDDYEDDDDDDDNSRRLSLVPSGDHEDEDSETLP